MSVKNKKEDTPKDKETEDFTVYLQNNLTRLANWEQRKFFIFLALKGISILLVFAALVFTIRYFYIKITTAQEAILKIEVNEDIVLDAWYTNIYSLNTEDPLYFTVRDIPDAFKSTDGNLITRKEFGDLIPTEQKHFEIDPNRIQLCLYLDKVHIIYKAVMVYDLLYPGVFLFSNFNDCISNSNWPVDQLHKLYEYVYDDFVTESPKNTNIGIIRSYKLRNYFNIIEDFPHLFSTSDPNIRIRFAEIINKEELRREYCFYRDGFLRVMQRVYPNFVQDYFLNDPYRISYSDCVNGLTDEYYSIEEEYDLYLTYYIFVNLSYSTELDLQEVNAAREYKLTYN